nr:MAG TPA: hypothetical protein [Caudoviricetes sp.]
MVHYLALERKILGHYRDICTIIRPKAKLDYVDLDVSN